MSCSHCHHFPPTSLCWVQPPNSCWICLIWLRDGLWGVESSVSFVQLSTSLWSSSVNVHFLKGLLSVEQGGDASFHRISLNYRICCLEVGKKSRNNPFTTYCTFFSRQWKGSVLLSVTAVGEFALFTSWEIAWLLHPYMQSKHKTMTGSQEACEQQEKEWEVIQALPECVTPLLSMWEWGRARSLLLAGLCLRGERTGGAVGKGARDSEAGKLCLWSLNERSCLYKSCSSLFCWAWRETTSLMCLWGVEEKKNTFTF